MIERLALALILIVVGVVAYRLWVARQKRTTPSDPLLSSLQPGVPAVVYFTTPNCLPCKTVQAPALAKLEGDLGVQVVRVDATEQPDAAARWGVLTAPTTFIIDGRGKTSAVNNGVADFHTLKRQIQATMSA
jgi:thiol-disulfide isomerase/thioredoxin